MSIMGCIFIAIWLVVMSFGVYAMHNQTSRVKPEKCQYMSMQISIKEFRERFLQQIEENKWGFIGMIDWKNYFYIQYFPKEPLRIKPGIGWRTLKGVATENGIAYEFVGWYSYRTKEFEQERLLNKLKELAS